MVTFHRACEYVGIDANKLTGRGLVDEPLRWATTGTVRTLGIALVFTGGSQVVAVANEGLSNLAQALGSGFTGILKRLGPDWVNRNVESFGGVLTNTWNAVRPTNQVHRVRPSLQPLVGKLATVAEGTLIMYTGTVLLTQMAKRIRANPKLLHDLTDLLTPWKWRDSTAYKADKAASKSNSQES